MRPGLEGDRRSVCPDLPGLPRLSVSLFVSLFDPEEGGVMGVHLQRQYRVVVLDARGEMWSCYGHFYEVTPLVDRVLEMARGAHGDAAVLQRLARPSAERWETVT